MADDIDERLSRRFGGDREEKSGGDDENAQNEDRSMNDSNEMPEDVDRNPLNVKRDWNARSFYLPDGLDRALSTAYKRLDLGLTEDNAGLTLKKTRHYYPLVVELGLERMERMEQEELMERIEQREREESGSSQ